MPRKPSAAAAYIGQRITEARRRYTMTQDELAYRAGIDSSNIRSYESGRAMPNIHTLVKIATALSTKPGELIDGLTLDQFDTAEHRRAG